MNGDNDIFSHKYNTHLLMNRISQINDVKNEKDYDDLDMKLINKLLHYSINYMDMILKRRHNNEDGNNDTINKRYEYKSSIPVLSIKHLLPYSPQQKVNKSLYSLKTNSLQKTKKIFNSQQNNELNKMKHDIDIKQIGFKNFCVVLNCDGYDTLVKNN